MSDSTPPTVSITTTRPPTYSFLAHPPPPQKKRPTYALPSPPPIITSRPRSNTFTAITSWATHVQPGSPAPCSPRRRLSISSRRSSISRGRRPSITSVRVPSGSFLTFIDTPTSGHRSTPSDFQPDLTSLGYTSAFVHLQREPVLSREKVAADSVPSNVPVSTDREPTLSKQPTLKRIRSLSVLKPIRDRGRSKSTAMPHPSFASSPKAKSKVAIAKRKKAKYADFRPIPLTNELALAQFVDGGSVETNIHRFNESHAKAAACSGQFMGVGDVYRDGKGGIWLDQDEEWEYAGLLGGEEETEDTRWVKFGANQTHFDAPGMDLAGEERRGSVSTQDSDLDPRCVMKPAEEQDDLAVYGGALAPIVLRKPNVSVLTVPSRTRRNATNLHDTKLSLDTAFPRNDTKTPGTFVQSSSRPKGQDRRRPAPLTLPPPSPLTRRPSNSPLDTDKVRRDFLDGSFEPEPAIETISRTSTSSTIHARRLSTGVGVLQPTKTNSSQTSVQRKGLSKKSSRLNMRGLWKAVGAKRDAK